MRVAQPDETGQHGDDPGHRCDDPPVEADRDGQDPPHRVQAEY